MGGDTQRQSDIVGEKATHICGCGLKKGEVRSACNHSSLCRHRATTHRGAMTMSDAPLHTDPPPQWVVIDTETTGLSNDDRIVEIAALAIDPETMETVGEFVTLLHPDRDTGASAVHGISDAMVQDSPRFAEIAETFAQFLKGRVLVAHNLNFDAGFLEREFTRAGVELDLGRGFCTWSQGTHTSLAKACERHGITLDGAHRAEADARATWKLLIALTERLTAEVEPVRT
ncbi:MAG: 3'-5' exonuclease [Actinobacteria bacterium]|nr:3'-5' exonuclease [Actinomycetota bacterium]